MRFIFVLFLTWKSFSNALADSCSDVDLNTDPTALGLVPRWEQGDTQLCYAFATAQLVDAYRIKKGDLHAAQIITSPLLLASQTIQSFHNKGSTYRGGKIEHAFKTVREKGICNARYVSDKWGKSNSPKILKLLNRCYFRGEKTDKKSVAEECLGQLAEEEIPRDLLPSLLEFTSYLSQPKEDFISSVLSSGCKEKHEMKALPAPTRYFRPQVDTMELVEKVHSLLGNKIPIGVNFCAEAVTDKNHIGHRDNTKKEWICEKGLRHSAIIAGRKNINGKCNFLIRDTSCESLNKTGPHCTNGEYWIEDTHLVKNTEGLIWLE